MGRRSDHTRDELYTMALKAARNITEAEGLRGLTTRRIAGEIGYTVGTLYNVFENQDDLIVHLNCATLDSLYEAVVPDPVGNEPEAALGEYARRYMKFIGKHPRLWRAVFEHQLPEGQKRPDWYHARVQRLLGLAEEALKPFFRPGEEAERLHHARVLWCSLYGISSLAASNSLHPTESATGLVDTLISNYVAELRRRRRATKSAGARKEKVRKVRRSTAKTRT